MWLGVEGAGFDLDEESFAGLAVADEKVGGVAAMKSLDSVDNYLGAGVVVDRDGFAEKFVVFHDRDHEFEFRERVEGVAPVCNSKRSVILEG